MPLGLSVYLQPESQINLPVLRWIPPVAQPLTCAESMPMSRSSMRRKTRRAAEVSLLTEMPTRVRSAVPTATGIMMEPVPVPLSDAAGWGAWVPVRLAVRRTEGAGLRDAKRLGHCVALEDGRAPGDCVRVAVS